MPKLRDWLADHWIVGAGFMAAALLTVAPVLGLPPMVSLIFLHSPVYMLHQVEEHAGGRFQAFANQRIFGGLEALTVTAILIINLPLVWGVNLLALYTACAFGAAWGLVAPYLLLVNGLSHLAASVRLRMYNPGLITSLLLFLPLSMTTIWKVGLTGGFEPQVIGAVLSIVVHVAIIAAIVRRYRSLRLQPAPV